MTYIIFIIIVFNLCVQIVTSGLLTTFRNPSYRSSIDIINFYNHHSRVQLCISDNPKEAIVWNTNLNWNSKSLIDSDRTNLGASELSSYPPDTDQQCRIDVDSQNCFALWGQHYANWSFTHSFDDPMGPVYDSRWEDFQDYKASYNYRQVKTDINGVQSTLVFGKSGVLVFSVRGTNDAHIVLCESQNVLSDFCYWLIIGGWRNSASVFRKCANGVPLGFPDQGSSCGILQATAKHNPLNSYEWRTFMLTWDAASRTLKLFDPDKLILSYTDNDYIASSKSTKLYHILFRNPDEEMLFRFHDYSYTLATEPGAILNSPALILGNSAELCIDMMVGLCKNCRLDVNIVDGSGKRQVMRTIVSSEAYKNVEHNLPMWQHERINSNVTGYPTPITLELIAVSSDASNEIGNHWAITKFEECLPQGTVKRLKMVASQDYDKRYFWPTVTCQRLSYDTQHSEAVDSTLRITKPPDDMLYCSNSNVKFGFGPQCATLCQAYFAYDCYGVAMCTQHRCFCTQGYEGADCNYMCGSGSYGYGCTEKCNNCNNDKCDPYSGLCKSECKEFLDRFLIPPYCDIVIETPSAPHFDQITETSARPFLLGTDNYNKINKTISFEIKSNSSENQQQTAQNLMHNKNGTLESIYYVIFTDLKPGTEYSVRMIININYEQNKHKNIFGKWSDFVTLCHWDKNFKIIPDERSLMIKKMYEQQAYSCPDTWYAVQLSTISSAKNESRLINTDDIGKKFPITFSYLIPVTNYEICINGADEKIIYCQRISTLEAAPSKVLGLVVNSVGSTEAEISWASPLTTNGILKGYNLTIKILNYKGCKSGVNTTTNLSTFKSFLDIPPRVVTSHTITDLIPYAVYKVTVAAYNSKLGAEISINFETTKLEIPTANFSNLNFEQNKITWTDPVDCWTISGPIAGARVFLYGVSANVEDFYDEYDTQWHSFTLGVTKIQTIYGNESYRAKIHVLHKLHGVINETAYAEISFTTDPSPPPKVEKLEIVEIDEEKKTTTLRWQKPSPPTNGEIIYYTIGFLGKNKKLSNIVKIFPNETCYLWQNFLCKTVVYPVDKKQYIEIKAFNKDVKDPGEPNTVNDLRKEWPPEAPKNISIKEIEKGTTYLKWQHPFITGGPMKKFLIHREIISTQLQKKPTPNDTEPIEFPISKYDIDYFIPLYLLPSTSYNISVQGIGNARAGKPESEGIITNSSLAFEYDPHPIPDNENSLIKIVIPPIINDTKDSMLHIVVKGPSICPLGGSLSNSLKEDVKVDYHEVAWRVGSFAGYKTANLTFIIGDELIYNGVSNCPLHIGSIYKIVIVVREHQNDSKAQTIVWRSDPIQIGPVPNKHYEAWAIPLVLLFIAIALVSYFYIKKKSRKYTDKNPTNQLIEPIPIYPVLRHKKKQLYKQESENKNPSNDPRESNFFSPTNATENIDRGCTESLYENLKCNSLIKLNEFQDYVKNSIETGKLDQQFDMLPRGQTKPWEYGKLPHNKPKNRYGNLIAYDETRVVLEQLPDEPHSDYINANYIKGYNKDRAYIATQGPKPNTLADFWRMVWQEKIRVICMLTNVMESGKVKSEQYWPEIGKETKYGKITVANVSHTVFADYTFRMFHITFGEECRKIHQFHYTAWPDHGVPAYTQPVVSYLKKVLATPSGNGPILVHCSAGVGRTGTIILCDICLRRAAAEAVIDAFGETEMIRRQRANMVDNKQQYQLAHLALVECLLALPTMIPCNNNLPARIQEYKKQLVLQQQSLEEFAWQDKALQPATALPVKLSDKNLAKNRFPDQVPTNSRLYIARHPTTDDDSNYIAGVYVDGARQKNNYIASQLPLPNTVGDFWRMVAEFKVELIVVLQSIDPDDETCGKFIPSPQEEIKPVPFLTLKGKAIVDSEIYIQQKVVLINNAEKPANERLITILTCKYWKAGKNQPPPKPAILVDFWQTAERISRSEAPTLVLCFDGVTNCGLYLAQSLLLERMGSERECDVCLAIRAIRRSRPDFCKDLEQFEYLYDAAEYYSGYFETYANFS